MAKDVISRETVIKAGAGQVSSDLGGESVILDVESGTYYGLDGVGALVWGLIQEPRRVVDLRDAILAEYDVAPDECERDLLELLAQLQKNGLIEVVDGALA